MASRKEQKEQARAARIAQEQAAAAGTQRTRRLQMFGGAIAIAVIVIVVAIVVSSGGGASTKNVTTDLATGTKEHQIVNSVDSLLSGIPQSGTVLGKSSAKVTMYYFGDLECPICQEFTLYVLPQFVTDQVKPGNVKVDYRSMCTATCGGNYSQSKSEQFFNSQQVAAYAAGKQDKFWNYTELFYHQQGKEDTGYANTAYLTGLARQSGVNLSTWSAARNDKSLLDQVNGDQTYAQSANLPGTPTLIMKGPNNKETIVNPNGGVPSYSQLVSAIHQVS